MNDFPVKIIKTGFSVCSPNWTTRHEMTVPFFRIYYIERGFAMVTVSGVRYKLQPGNVYFIPGVYPFLNECPKEMRVHWLHCLPVDSKLEHIISGIEEVHHWPINSLGLYKEIISSSGSRDFAESYPEWFGLHAFVIFIISRLAYLYADKCSFMEIPSNIRKSIEYMDSHYIRNPTLSQIASTACLAPVYFHRLFKKYCGLTPHAYMEKKRMFMAQSILSSTDKTLEEIALDTGYENSFYFSRVFRKYFKTSPGMARKLCSRP